MHLDNLIHIQLKDVYIKGNSLLEVLRSGTVVGNHTRKPNQLALVS